MNKPSAKELLDKFCHHDGCPETQLAARVEKVLALHKPSGGPLNYCKGCLKPSPCPTVRLLDGEDA